MPALDPELARFFQEAAELLVANELRNMSRYMSRSVHAAMDNRPSSTGGTMERAREIKVIFDYGVDQTTRFGIPTPTRLEDGKPSPAFYAWIDWWGTYLDSLPPEEIESCKQQSIDRKT